MGAEYTLAVLAGPNMSGICVGCERLDHHGRISDACSAGRSKHKWYMCRL